jgi:hypothetical protein
MDQHKEMSPAEVQFRYDGLVKLLDLGLDFWWFDCHWHDLIPGIACSANDPKKPGKKSCALDDAAWGQTVFTDVMRKYNQINRPTARTFMLGCSNSEHPTNHRTPVWWTGE